MLLVWNTRCNLVCNPTVQQKDETRQNMKIAVHAIYALKPKLAQPMTITIGLPIPGLKAWIKKLAHLYQFHCNETNSKKQIAQDPSRFFSSATDTNTNYPTTATFSASDR
jgi:hypothetical protein